MNRLKLVFRHIPLPFWIHLIFWGGYFVLLWKRQFTETKDGVIAGWIGAWADGAAHLSYMSAFAFRDDFVITHPLYLGHKFTYPFVADMIGGYLVYLGLSIPAAYELLGLILSLVLVLLIFLFFRMLFKNDWVALISSGLFFWSGGVGAIWFFKDAMIRGLLSTLVALPREYTHLGEEKIEWINIISGQLVPQRAFLLGIPAGLVILMILWRYINDHISKRWMVLAGTISGLLPIIHIHTMIVVGIAVTWLFVVDVVFYRKTLVPWLYYLVPATLIGVPILLWLLLPLVDESFFSWYPGWMAKSKKDNFLWFWIKNWGIWPLLVLTGFWMADKKVKVFLFPFIILCVIANLMLFQPYDYDNAKILTWVYLALSGCAGLFLVNLFQKRNLVLRLFAIAMFIGACLTGMLDTARLLQPHTAIRMFSAEEIDLAKRVRKNTPSNAVFLTSDSSNHWVPTLTGRQIVMGFRGWMWTYGFKYYDRERDVKAIFQGTDKAPELIDYYGIDYVVVGPSELYGDYKANEAFFKTRFPVAFDSEHYRVYYISRANKFNLSKKIRLFKSVNSNEKNIQY